MGVLVVHGIMNSFSTRWLDKITRYYALINIVVTIAAIITLTVVNKNKLSNREVWVDVVPATGWENKGFSFLFGFLAVAWTMTDYDATAHIAEEIHNAAFRAPLAIIVALGTTAVLGWFLSIAMAYCAGDFSTMLVQLTDGSPTTGNPAVQIFYASLGRVGCVVFTALGAVILSFTGVTALQANSRTIFALSRDEMLPLSHVWSKVTKKNAIPLNAVWLNIFICAILGVIACGSIEAIYAIFAVTAICLDISYCIPIFAKIVWGERMGFKRGPIHLGRFSKWVNAYSCIWTAFLAIVFLFPEFLPATALNFNYAIVVLAAVILFAIVYWFAGARKWYVGPRTHVSHNPEAVAAPIIAQKDAAKEL